jgi:hypothetical protein
MSLRAVPKDLRAIAKTARAAGWTITRTASQHSRWQAPSGAIVICSGSPSDANHHRVVCRDLRRHGLRI